MIRLRPRIGFRLELRLRPRINNVSSHWFRLELRLRPRLMIRLTVGSSSASAKARE